MILMVAQKCTPLRNIPRTQSDSDIERPQWCGERPQRCGMVAQECTPTSRPQRDRPCSALCPQCFRSLSAISATFPQCYRLEAPRTVSAVFPQSCGTAHVPHCVRNVSAVFPLSFRNISAVLPARSSPHCFRNLSALFPKF